MALKDWKKIRNNRWQRINPKKTVSVFKASKSYYAIFIDDDGIEEDKYVKSKSEALKFAKDYMRKH